MRSPKTDFAEAVGWDRIANIVSFDYKRSSVDASSDVWYVIWEEATVEGDNLAVHWFTYDDHDRIAIMDSGQYRLSSAQAHRLVAELVEA